MVDISFSVPAKLLAFEGEAGSASGIQNETALNSGSLGRLVGIVMAAEPAERWRYAIVTGEQPQLEADQIAALASTRSYADWHAGQV